MKIYRVCQKCWVDGVEKERRHAKYQQFRTTPNSNHKMYTNKIQRDYLWAVNNVFMIDLTTSFITMIFNW